jgi:NTP pyrophosphatase (non-canonical NTP hydrolase)
MADNPLVIDPLVSLRDTLRTFAAQREWDQFHSPKNLAAAISVEAAELLQHFQWMSDAESTRLSSDVISKVREEMADVLLYLIRLADKLDVNLFEAAESKIKMNAIRYPIEKARGTSKKYTEL